MSKTKPKSQSVSVSEVIIQIQSFLLLSLSIAGIVSTSAVVAGFRALTNAQSAAYIITDGKIVTDQEVISVERCQQIIDNYSFVNVSILCISLVIFIASSIRLYKNYAK
jgi:hypothetical protein